MLEEVWETMVVEEEGMYASHFSVRARKNLVMVREVAFFAEIILWSSYVEYCLERKDLKYNKHSMHISPKV